MKSFRIVKGERRKKSKKMTRNGGILYFRKNEFLIRIRILLIELMKKIS